MTKRQLLLNTISFTILPVAVFSVTPYPGIFTNAIVLLQNTTFWWMIEALVLLAFLTMNRFFYDRVNSKNLRVVGWYLIWNIFCFFRGAFIAETYWDWKGLIGNTMALLIPIVAYLGTNKEILQSMLSFYVKYTLPLFFVFILLISTDAYGFYLVPVSFLMLFFPILTTRWKVVVAAFTMLVLLIDFDARSNVIKFGVPIVLLLVYYFRRFISIKWLELLRNILIILPIVLFSLAASGIFNVFNMDNYIKGNYEQVKRDAKGEKVENNLKADTRTFLYVEVLFTAKKYNCWWIGRSPARGNISEAFGEEDENHRGERLSNEVAILNVFTWSGIIGVLLYLLVFYRASFIALNRSNNIFSKMIGMFIAFRWLYGWVEDVNNYSLNFFMLWLMIGLCFSKSFRAMSNKEVTYWARGIFNINYKKLSGKKMVESISEEATISNTYHRSPL
ncbi:MAG: O-antigen ligase family protein [Bacteroidota bacterium]|nr:O-antigen ligase family protein [Bacteroidota bacterium]